MKVASEQILHKSEAGVVKVGIENDQEFTDTYNLLIKQAKNYNPDAKIDGILIEKMAPKGEEVIVGMKRDPGFGPMLMFGMGGVFVELFKDVAFRIAPIGKDDAEKMIQETKAFQLLNGWRGGEKYDIEAIMNIILRLSQLAMDFPQIQEVEINPLRVFPDGKGALGLRLQDDPEVKDYLGFPILGEFIGDQCSFTSFSVIHDRLWIVLADNDIHL